jgi:hypothetical protein
VMTLLLTALDVRLSSNAARSKLPRREVASIARSPSVDGRWIGGTRFIVG